MNRKLTIWAALAVLALATAAFAAGDMTLKGSVVSTTADQLVIRSADGEKSFVVNAKTMKPFDLAIGTQVTVTYHDEYGQLVATQVAAAEPSSATGATAAQPSTPTPSSSTYAQPADEPVPTTTAPDPSTPSYSTQASSSSASPSMESTSSATTEDELPAGASRLPLLALLGLGAGAGALLLRRIA